MITHIDKTERERERVREGEEREREGERKKKKKKRARVSPYVKERRLFLRESRVSSVDHTCVF